MKTDEEEQGQGSDREQDEGERPSGWPQLPFVNTRVSVDSFQLSVRILIWDHEGNVNWVYRKFGRSL